MWQAPLVAAPSSTHGKRMSRPGRRLVPHKTDPGTPDSAVSKPTPIPQQKEATATSGKSRLTAECSEIPPYLGLYSERITTDSSSERRTWA
jgi:hypothetical protein